MQWIDSDLIPLSVLGRNRGTSPIVSAARLFERGLNIMEVATITLAYAAAVHASEGGRFGEEIGIAGGSVTCRRK